jgi:hypothetical protein
MKAIWTFLKPNWWKIIIFGIVIIITFSVGVERYSYPVYFKKPFVSPLYFIKVETNFYLSLFILLIYWYLLACLIYFIIAKIKRLITKPK